MDVDPKTSEESHKSSRTRRISVITAGRELVVCEGKFFYSFNAGALTRQLLSQRHQVSHLLLNRLQIRAYRHLAIIPRRLEGMAPMLYLPGRISAIWLRNSWVPTIM